MYGIRVSLSFNKLKKISNLLSVSVSAVPGNLIISSCNFKYLYFRITTDPNFRFKFVDFMFLSIVLTCIKFYFLEDNFLVFRDIEKLFEFKLAPADPQVVHIPPIGHQCLLVVKCLVVSAYKS